MLAGLMLWNLVSPPKLRLILHLRLFIFSELITLDTKKFQRTLLLSIKDILEMRELFMLISFFQLLVIWRNKLPMLTLMVDLNKPEKHFHHQDSPKMTGWFLEHSLKKLVHHSHMTPLKSSEPELPSFHHI